MENVLGMVSYKNGSVVEQIKDDFTRIGYPNVDCRVLNAVDYGVPQSRKRVFFIATRNKKIISLDLTLLIAGTIYRGEFEARLKQIIEEISNQPEYILFIDEVHNIIGAGAAQTADIIALNESERRFGVESEPTEDGGGISGETR